jgi:hypothetical protein
MVMADFTGGDGERIAHTAVGCRTAPLHQYLPLHTETQRSQTIRIASELELLDPHVQSASVPVPEAAIMAFSIPAIPAFPFSLAQISGPYAQAARPFLLISCPSGDRNPAAPL